MNDFRTTGIRTAAFTLMLGGFLISTTANAVNAWYAEAGVTRTRAEFSTTEFNPILPRLKLGFSLSPKIMLEVQYAGSGDDKEADSKLEIESISAAYLRLDSGIQNGMRAYVLLGGAETRFARTGPGIASTGTETQSDFSWGLGFEDRVWTKNTLLTLEYAEYYHHEDVTIAGVSLGFKYEY